MKNSSVQQRIKRIQWWQHARFGMFIHWGVYSVIGRHEWVMNRERIPVKEYEAYADAWKPKPHSPRQWARLAKKAGMKYMVLTTKHHEGFSLWDSQTNPFNAVQRGPQRDLVQEYVDACHEFGLKIGFYYSLLDWHHPDGARCAVDEKARRRFCDYTYALVAELMTQYGKIDILWYDVSWPLKTAELWESQKLNAMVRGYQPQILINNRSMTPEDFSTPEDVVKPESPAEGRGWEACMTYNSVWGYMPHAVDWRPNREVIDMLNHCTAYNGNLLLNVGPKPDGTIPSQARTRLNAIGRWLEQHAEPVYGPVIRADETKCEGVPTGGWYPWTLKDNGRTVYYWCKYWPSDGQLVIGGIRSRIKRITNLTLDTPIPFTQQGERLVITGLPATCPDKIAGVTIFKLECASKFRHLLGAGPVLMPLGTTSWG
jgi:alpha-L-fucosidase